MIYYIAMLWLSLRTKFDMIPPLLEAFRFKLVITALECEDMNNKEALIPSPLFKIVTSVFRMLNNASYKQYTTLKCIRNNNYHILLKKFLTCYTTT